MVVFSVVVFLGWMVVGCWVGVCFIFWVCLFCVCCVGVVLFVRVVLFFVIVLVGVWGRFYPSFFVCVFFGSVPL